MFALSSVWSPLGWGSLNAFVRWTPETGNIPHNPDPKSQQTRVSNCLQMSRSLKSLSDYSESEGSAPLLSFTGHLSSGAPLLRKQGHLCHSSPGFTIHFGSWFCDPFRLLVLDPCASWMWCSVSPCSEMYRFKGKVHPEWQFCHC